LASSPLSNTIKRTSDLLRLGASGQVTEYENRFESLRALHERLLSDFIISDFNNEQAFETAKQFFNSSTIRFSGIDGTMYSRPLFDLIIFFGGAYASTGTIKFSEHENKPTIEYDLKTLHQSAGISSVVPVYINEVPDIDQAFFDPEQPDEVSPNKPLIDETIVSNTTIANWLMTFAEYYLAYKFASDPKQNTKIVLLDRSLSIERASLLYDTSKRTLWKAKSALLGYEVNGEALDENDFVLGRQHIINSDLKIPPARADYLRYAVINLIQQKSSLTEADILKELKITEEKRVKRAQRYLKSSVKQGILIEKAGAYGINPKYSTTWDRLQKLVTTLGDRFFYEQKAETPTSNLMKIQKSGKERWLTTLDIAFLTLFCLEMLIEGCWKNRILLIGITKDTAARDFKRQLVPILQNEGLVKGTITPEEMERLPNTDRMILQSTSLFNAEKMKVPWALIEYDSAFKTMLPDPQNRKGYVVGARKNRISLEKTFLKTYIQLSQAESDPMLRSNVLLIDRLVQPAYDYTPNSTIQFWNEFHAPKEPVEALLFKSNKIENPLQNLVMTILTTMTSPSIPEAFGHNKPLFIADKIAKYNFGQFKRIADSTATWILNNHKLRKFIFYMSTFRERRTQIETTRRETI